MREEEKALAGLLYAPGDPELRALKLKAHNLNTDYNATYEHETDKRAAILRALLPDLGPGGFLQGPIYFHYGTHTHTSGKTCSPISISPCRTTPKCSSAIIAASARALPS